MSVIFGHLQSSKKALEYFKCESVCEILWVFCSSLTDCNFWSSTIFEKSPWNTLYDDQYLKYWVLVKHWDINYCFSLPHSRSVNVATLWRHAEHIVHLIIVQRSEGTDFLLKSFRCFEIIFEDCSTVDDDRQVLTYDKNWFKYASIVDQSLIIFYTVLLLTSMYKTYWFCLLVCCSFVYLYF